MNKNYVNKDGFLSFAFVVMIYIIEQLVLGFALLAVESGSIWYWLILAVSSLCIGVTALIYAKLRKIDFLSVTRVNVAPKWAHIAWGLLAAIGLIHFMIPINSWIGDLIEKIGLKRPSVDLPLQIVPLILVASVLPAFTEEAMFRGTIGNALTRGQMSWWKGALISGALFALFHMNPAQTLHQFVLGCFLTLLVYRSGSLWTSIIIHLFNNVVAVVLTLFVEESGFYEKNGVWLCIAGAVVFGLSLWGYLATTKNHAAQTADETENETQTVKLDGKTTIMFAAAVAVCVLMWAANLFA